MITTNLLSWPIYPDTPVLPNSPIRVFRVTRDRHEAVRRFWTVRTHAVGYGHIFLIGEFDPRGLIGLAAPINSPEIWGVIRHKGEPDGAPSYYDSYDYVVRWHLGCDIAGIDHVEVILLSDRALCAVTGIEESACV